MSGEMASEEGDAILRLAGLACRRGERLRFRGLDLALAAGAAVTITGHNGCGKSSLLRTLAGLMRPDAGEVRLSGRRLGTERERDHEELRFLGHLDGIKPALTVGESLAFTARLFGLGAAETAEKIPEALAAWGIEGLGERPGRQLSQGQRRRAALARLSLAPARLWLLDEPTNGLDSDGLARLETAVAGHRAAGGAVLAASHVALPLGPEAGRLALDDPALKPAGPAAAMEDWSF